MTLPRTPSIGRSGAVSRVALIAAASVAVIVSCGREPTAPGGAALGRYASTLRLRPVFPASFTQALEQSSGGTGLVAFTHVHVVLHHSDGTVALDTMVDFPPGADSVPLSLSVPLLPSAPATGEPMTLTLGYLDAQGATVFSGGPVGLTAAPTSPGTPPPPPVQIPVVYTGQGAGAARVRIAPRSGTAFTGNLFNFGAAAQDGTGATIANTPIFWTSLDPAIASPTAPGSGSIAAHSLRGTARIVAQLLTGPADTVTLSVLLRPSALALVSGSGQSETVSSALAQPLVVRVTASDGVGVAGVLVAFAVTSGAGAVGNASAVTDAGGFAQTTWTLGAAAGTQTVSASAVGLTGSPVSFGATAIPATPTKLVVTTQPASTTAGAQLTVIAFTAQDAGNNVATAFTGPVTVTLASNPGSATLGGTTTVNAVAGVATFTTLTLNRTGSGYTLSATSGSLAGTTTQPFDISPGPVAQLVFTSQPVGTTGGLSLGTVALTAQDLQGNIIPTFTGMVTVALGANPGAGTLAGTLSVPAVAGVATFTTLRVSRAGTGYTLTASSAGLTSGTSTAFNIAVGPAALISVAIGGGQSGGPSTALPAQVVVLVSDQGGNPIAGRTVNFAVATGGGAVAPASGVSSATGLVSASWTLGALAGAQTLNATSAGLAPSPLVIQATSTGSGPGAPIQLAFGVQPATAVAGASVAPAIVVQARDALGAVSTSFTGSVTLAFGANPGGSALGGTLTVAAVAGVATFNNITLNRTSAGYTLSATSPGLTTAVSGAFSILPAAASTLAIVSGNNQFYPNNYGNPRVSMVLSVKDAFGNLVPGASVTFTASAGATVNGLASTTIPTNAAGLATAFSAIAAASGSATVTATLGALAPVTFASQRLNQGNWASACRLTTLGSAYCWGDNGYGTIGNGGTTPATTPAAVSGGLVFASLVSNYGSHQCGLTAAGQAYCWGRNSFGEVGDNSTTDRLSPVPVAGGLTFTSLSASSYNTCGVTPASQVYCWGWTGGGIMGDGDEGSIRTVPTLVITGGRVYSKVAVLDDYVCGIETGGVLSCWGHAPDGTHITPATVATGVALTSLTAGFYHICGLTAAGAGYCWGTLNSDGEVGDGSTGARATPSAVSGGLTFAEIRAYAYNTCGRTTTNVLYCWGGQVFGSTIGDGSSGVARMVPTAVLGGIPIGSLMGGGIGFSCSAAITGQPFCWGGTALGSATTFSSTTPSPVDWVEGTVGTPRSIIINGGDGQSVLAGGRVPIDPAVLVRDFGGSVVSGATVSWAVTAGGGSVTSATTTTGGPPSNTPGVAAVGWILGAAPGANTLTATLTVGATVIGIVVFTATGN
ncbi:MAG: hypothetical protein ACHQQ3_01005 [Gemmatimonadales bacterium]